MRKLHTVIQVLLTLRFYYRLSAHPRMFEEEEEGVGVGVRLYKQSHATPECHFGK